MIREVSSALSPGRRSQEAYEREGGWVGVEEARGTSGRQVVRGAKVLLVIKMRKMQQLKNAKYALMRGMITTEKRRGEEWRVGRVYAVGGSQEKRTFRLSWD